MRTDGSSTLEAVTRPLLELMQLVTGMETSFVTTIDWASQEQEVLYALNTAELQVPEGAVVDWSDSMCRLVFLNQSPHSNNVRGEFPGSLGAVQMGMQTFFAVPIVADDRTIGTVCGASQSVIDMDAHGLQLMELVARAIAVQLETEQESRVHRRRAEDAELLASTDELTGLPNRRAFNARWEEELARSALSDSDIALLLIDVDEFKEVNDEQGHAVGDDVLRAVARVLRKEIRSEDFPARIGGDEFALVLGRGGAGGAITLGSRIQDGFARAGRLLGVDCTLSIGVSTSTSSLRRSMAADADRALYRSKHRGRNRIEVWDGLVA